MPIVQISLPKGRSPQQKLFLCRSIQNAIKDVFCISHDNFHHRIVEYDQDHMLLPSGTSDSYVFIELDMFPGRDGEIKQALFKQIEKNLLECSIQPNDIMIIYREPPLENWYIRGKGGREISSMNRNETQQPTANNNGT